MIKVLKLQKAVIAIVIGIVALIVAKIMSSRHISGSTFVLTLAGICFIVGALLFLYPILFAKKVDPDGKKVELEPVGKESE
ncbi:MAG: isoleucyl-tRNA synthetase [Pedobacter sp.]|nr:isoleucyl-tRNA synthetase [Pedobacter sp.]MDQ8053617.1 isoleucyl-tRNA synthetase [Pedobacter sp.]